MSMDHMTSERVCYVQCNFCNTILAVSVPSSSSMLNVVTVRCGHCANLLSVNIGALVHQSVHVQDFQKNQYTEAAFKDGSCTGSSSKYYNRYSPLQAEHEKLPKIPIRPPEKRQRVPSAYNRFIKEEIQRIKATTPEISHREAFSTAAKNWAHFPHIHFGLKLDSNKQSKQLEHAAVAGGEGMMTTQKSLGFY